MKIIGLFLVAIPAVLFLILLLWDETENIHNLVIGTIRISLAIGAFIFVFFLALIIAEQIQDHRIDVEYQKNRDRKLPLADGNYECQYCGNQKVKENDKVCSVCGRELK